MSDNQTYIISSASQDEHYPVGCHCPWAISRPEPEKPALPPCPTYALLLPMKKKTTLIFTCAAFDSAQAYR